MQQQGDHNIAYSSNATQPAATTNPSGPIAGDNFRDWSDRMRNVEEIVNDPALRDEAARIRQRAAEIRAQAKQNGGEVNWDSVNQTVGKPLADLRDAVSRELMSRENSQALVPIDKEPVPPAYADDVKRYYERLGMGGAAPAASNGASQNSPSPAAPAGGSK